jgi:hypothetical protein
MIVDPGLLIVLAFVWIMSLLVAYERGKLSIAKAVLPYLKMTTTLLKDISTYGEKNMMTSDGLLLWLVREESSLLGECNGPKLEDLHDRGLVAITRPRPDLDEEYSQVVVTNRGHEYLESKGLRGRDPYDT